VVLEWLGSVAIASRMKRGVNGLRLFRHLCHGRGLCCLILDTLTITFVMNDTISHYIYSGKKDFHSDIEGRCRGLDVRPSFFWLSWLCDTHFFKDEKVDLNTTPVYVFLPVRWIEFSSEDQVISGQRGYDGKICQEIESDRKQFQYFLKFVEEQGAPLSEDKCEFGWQKELDPHDDWRSVRFPLLTQCLHTVAHIYLYLVSSIEAA
jgi:hypothetical protein